MAGPLSSEERQELIAGYVLGDLTSAEAELFKRLLTEQPELQSEVVALQDALAMMPYGLEDVEPREEVRSQILSVAEAELNLSPGRDVQFRPSCHPWSRYPRRWSWAMSTMAATLALACGLVTFQLRHQVRTLHAQYSQSVEQSGLPQTWAGLSHLLQDHQSSMDNPTGPVDFVVQQPGEILPQVQGFHTTVAALPLLPKGKLLGGSNCQLGVAQGLRLTYQLGADETVSAYQLVMSEDDFPELQAAQLTLQQPDGTGVVLWREDDYLYALVAEMPMAELQGLVYAIEGS
ncbi:MAG: hypothetical protein F6K65_30830 [Moorea sp. SIO3C2]|nr:hypothetical protein [Moorena sp. SIO3C2]